MAQHTQRRPVVSREDPWRWLTFSSFWGGVYYLLVSVGLIAGHRTESPQINRQPALVSFLVYIVAFVSGGSLLSLVEQRIVRRSAKDQSRKVIASGLLEPSIPLQAIGGAAGAVVPSGWSSPLTP